MQTVMGSEGFKDAENTLGNMYRIDHVIAEDMRLYTCISSADAIAELHTLPDPNKRGKVCVYMLMYFIKHFPRNEIHREMQFKEY